MTKFTAITTLTLAVFLALATFSQAAFVPAPLPADPGTARGTYNPITGEFWFSIGTNLITVGVETPGILILGLSPHVGSQPAQRYDSDVLAYFNNVYLPVGIWSQGFIAPPGLSVTPDGTVTQLRFGYTVSRDGDYYPPVDVIRIPEPASIALLATALAGGIYCRVIVPRIRWGL